MSARGFDILTALLERPDEVVAKSTLFELVWPGLMVQENTLQVHVSALRKALAPGMSVTVHGRGYKYSGPRPTEIDAGSSGILSPALERVSASGSRPVIAVLPFTNMSGNADQDYFSDGITEDIIIELSRYRPLTVV